MKSNDLKKGAVVVLKHSNWVAVIADNMKGNTRMATVYGNYTETGSIYVHDIDYALTGPVNFAELKGGEDLFLNPTDRPGLKAGTYLRERIDLTDAQKKLRRDLEDGGW